MSSSLLPEPRTGEAEPPVRGPATPTTGGIGPDTAVLVETNLPVVGYLAAEFAHRLPSHVDLDDLRSAGFLALIQAAQAYDAARGVPFKRFASLRIRGAMLDELRSRDWASRSVRAKARQVEAAEDELAGVFGRRPTRAEVAERVGLPVSSLADFDEDLHRSTLLSLQGFDGAVDEHVLTQRPSPEELLLSRERTAYLVDAVVALPDRLRRIVVGLYYDDLPIAALAAELGVTESRISQMRTQALTMLRAGLDAALDGNVSTFDRPDGCVARRRATYLAAVTSRSTFGDRVSGKALIVS